MSTGTTVPTTNGTFDPDDVKRKAIDEKLHTAFNQDQIEVLDALYSGGGGGSDSIWKPDVTDDGTISWERSSSTSKPSTRNIKGPKGDKGDAGSLPMYYDTCEGWNSQTTLVAEAGAIYVYTDYKQVGGVNVSGIKFGDGTSYLIDVPFQDAQFQEHILDNVRHITEEERAFWNSKIRALITGENLVLTEL